jgi:catechol 2,3-dioxygenase-like lactoylglutathione lyase family enzyme
MKQHRNFLARAVSLVLAFSAATGLASAQTQTPPLNGIAHIALRVHNLDASRAFYEKLGFVSAFNLKHDDGVVYESFIKINDKQFIELYPTTEKDTQVGFLHLCFEGADLEAIYKDYVAHGLTPKPVRKAGAGNLLFTLAGPMQVSEPQNIEYTQYMPGSLHTNDTGKDLGPNRIATKLFSVSLGMQDIGVARDFYANQLSFTSPDPRNPMILALPGTSGQQIEIVSVDLGHKARFTLESTNLSKSTKRLKADKIPYKKSDAGLTLDDPDGNNVQIKQQEKPDLFDPLTKLLP